MPKPSPPRLRFGSYRTPRFRYGRKVDCEVRGEVIIVGLSNGRIPWPMGRIEGKSNRALIIYGALADAVRREAAVAVCYWWGVTGQTVSRWRGIMGVDPNTAGSRELRREHGLRLIDHTGPAMWAKAHDPERAAKIAAAKRGKPRPPEVIEAMRAANVGRPLSKVHRQKLSEIHRQRGTRPPKAGRPWTAKEDAILRESTAAATAKKTGRSLSAIYTRRRQLGLPDGRKPENRSVPHGLRLDGEPARR